MAKNKMIKEDMVASEEDITVEVEDAVKVKEGFIFLLVGKRVIQRLISH